MRAMFFLKKQKIDLHRLLLDQADKTLEGLAAFEEYVHEPRDTRALKVRELRGESRALRRVTDGALDGHPPSDMDRKDRSYILATTYTYPLFEQYQLQVAYNYVKNRSNQVMIASGEDPHEFSKNVYYLMIVANF